MQPPFSPLTQLERLLPKSPRFHLLRERLLTPLLLGDYRLTLLHGPAGCGKSTLLADCARQAAPGTTLLWLDLRGRTLAPKAFFARLLQGLGERPDAAGEERLVALLHQREQPLWLMLDDFPREADSPLDAALGQLLGIQNASLRWWVSARRRPQCGLPRLLLENQLQAVGPDALFFTREEVAALLAARGCNDEEQALRLFERSHGWCAAVAMDNLQDSPQARSAARADILGEYLRQELLDELPTALAQALSILSLLPQFDRALCNHVLGETAACSTFDALQTRDLLAPQPTPGTGWYAVLPVIAERLAGQVETARAEAVHLQACHWLEGAGELRLAIDHARAAHQQGHAALLLERLGNNQLINVNQAYKMLDWSHNLPQSLLRSTANLVLLHALMLALAMRGEEARRCLDHLGAFLPAPDARQQRRLLAAAQAVLAVIGLAEGRAAQVEECSRQALEYLNGHDWFLRLICCSVMIRQWLFFGDLEQARRLVNAQLKRVRPFAVPTSEVLLELYQAEVLELEGELMPARNLLESGWNRLRNAAVGETGVAARLQLQLGRLLLCRGQLALAEQHLAHGYRLALAVHDSSALLGLVGLAQVAILNEEGTKAESLLNQAEQLAQRSRISETGYRNIVDLGRARLCIQRRDLARAGHLLRAILTSYQTPRHVTQAHCNRSLLFECERLLAAIEMLEGRHTEARRQLLETLEKAITLGFRTQACEAKLALALNALLADSPRDALYWLQQGLQEAETMAFLLPVERLRRTRPELFELIADEARSSLLSEREVDVLRLVAAGHSNQEIAERLFISVFTVKSHVQRLCMKLEVKRRTQAVAKAKSLGILR